MFKKTMLAVSVGLVFSMSGCGGGGSSDSTPQAIVTGTGYYVDSAVNGVKTKCGAKEGTTGADGKFTFEVGKGCTFFLGDIKLRDIDKDILKDGVTVYETNKYTTQVLQSLDSDGNPTNGITISDEFVTALKTANITTLPTNEAETTAMLAVIDTAGGTIVTQTDAQSHAIKTLMSGKTFYIPGIEENGDKHLTKVIINAGATHLTWQWIIGATNGGEGDISIDGTTMMLAGSEDQEYLGHTADYVSILEHNNDGSTYNARWYEDRAKAEAYMATLSAPNNPSSQTEIEALVIGKTYYITACDTYTENGQTIINNHVETLQFNSDNTMKITWIQNDSLQERILTYSLLNETLTLHGTDQGDVVISLAQVKAFYKTKAQAEAKLATDCS